MSRFGISVAGFVAGLTAAVVLAGGIPFSTAAVAGGTPTSAAVQAWGVPMPAVIAASSA